MLVSSEASPLLLYVHVHVYVYHVHIHFFYSVSDCASGCSTLLVVLFLAVMYLSIYILRVLTAQHESSEDNTRRAPTCLRLPCSYSLLLSDCASGCSTLLVFLFLARRGYSLSYLGLALLQRRALIPHPHILTSPHPHIPTSPHSPHPHIPTSPHSPLTPMVIRHPSTKSRGHANWYVPVQISR